MKQAWSRRRRVDGRILLVLALLMLSVALASCGKTKREEQTATPPPSQGWNITSEPAQTVPGKAVQKAMGERCKENVRQLRQLIELYQGDNGNLPPALSSLPDAARIGKCPISRKEYAYDPATGQVSCAFPGHEKF